MKKELSKFYGSILTGILSFLGFSSSFLSACAYGSPHANYKVSGQVTDARTELPIANIEVNMSRKTTYTDAQGYFDLTLGDATAEPVYDVAFRDVDGVTNGEYQSLDTLADFTDAQLRGGDGRWYEGEATSALNVQLKPKE
jgi:putative lipoprotein (rSAM/lipoprotein system)